MIKAFIVGTGTMGRGLAQLFSQADFIEKIYWKSNSEEKASAGLHFLDGRWEHSVNKNKITRDDWLRFKKKIINVYDYTQVAKSDFLIEAVKEDMATKCEVFRQISEFANERTVLATNTSSLSVTAIASNVKKPERVIGLHFFNPAPVMQLTEVVSGFLTSDDTAKYAYELSKSLGKSPVHVNESPGFVVNRMLIPMINEAIGVLAEGVASAQDIDAAMCNGANHPIGPLALADMIGNDVCLSIMEVLHTETGDPKYRAYPLLRKMVRAGKLGRKTKSGFFEYQ